MPNDSPLKETDSDHPGPGVVRLFAGMVIAPLAWALQVLIGYSVAAYACYPTDVALVEPLWPHLRLIVGSISVVLWIVLLVGCAIAWANWKATRPHSDVTPHRIMQSGDGRPRFMALCGVVVSGLFAVVLLFTSVGILWVPTCGP